MYEFPYSNRMAAERLHSDIPLATWRLPGERCFWISLQGAEHGDGGDCSCQAGEACRSP